MNRKFMAVLAFVPAVLAAQGGGAKASTYASARSGSRGPMSVDAEMNAARKRGLPDDVIRRRVAEARESGSSEAQLAVAARRTRVMMEAAVESMIAGGHARPSDQEIENGALAMDQGFTRSQVEAVARSAPSDRSLSVAFDVLTKLSQRGLPVSRALEQVTSKLQAGQSDDQINAMLVVRTGLTVRQP